MKILAKIGAVGMAAVMLFTCGQYEVRAAAASVCGIEAGTNIEAQNYKTCTSPVKSYLAPCGSQLMRVQALSDNSVWVEYYNSDFSLSDVMRIPLELPVFGGFYAAEDGCFYIVSGAYNKAEDDSAEVFRITKYDSSWNRLSSASLYGANTIEPFGAGAARFAEYGGYLVIRTAHGMYKSKDGFSHQANVTIQLDMNRMEITDSFTKIMNIDFGYVSHSFNQFIKIDNNHIVALDHGDAYPRSLVIGKYTSDVTSGKFISGAKIYDYNEIYNIPGRIGDNNTGVSAGGFEVSDTGYLTAINSVDMNSYNPNGERNICVIVTPKEGNGFGESCVKQITTDGGYNTPQLVKTGSGSFILLWSKNNTVFYAGLDGAGNMTSPIYSLAGNLSDCAPIVNNGRIIWYSYERENITFYSISAADLSDNSTAQVIAGHDYEFIGAEGGTAKFRCRKCGDNITKTVPVSMKIWGKTSTEDPYFHRPFPTALNINEQLYYLESTEPENTDNSDIEVLISDESVLSCDKRRKILIPVAEGETEVTFRLKYNPEVHETYKISVSHEHTFSEEWTIDVEPTCAAVGSKSKHCTICGEKSEITEIPVLEHEFSEEFITEREATCSRMGVKYRMCKVCGKQTDITDIPFAEHDCEITVVEPTREKMGYTLKTCKNRKRSACGNSSGYSIRHLCSRGYQALCS